MKIFAETKRRILREILPIDIDGMFELDSDPDVHEYLGNHKGGLSITDASKQIEAMLEKQPDKFFKSCCPLRHAFCERILRHHAA